MKNWTRDIESSILMNWLLARFCHGYLGSDNRHKQCLILKIGEHSTDKWTFIISRLYHRSFKSIHTQV